jgi:hypothetical protein
LSQRIQRLRVVGFGGLGHFNRFRSVLKGMKMPAAYFRRELAQPEHQDDKTESPTGWP